MERRRLAWTTAALAAALAAATDGAGAQGAAPATRRGGAPPPAQQAPAAEGTALFSADVVIDESVVDESGALVERRPQTRFRLVRRRVNGVLETEITHPPARLFPKGPLTDPRGGYRYVIDDAFANPRIYDPSGKLVAVPEAAPAPAGSPRAGRFVFADADVRERRRELARQLGPSVGKQGGRDRYVSHEGDLVTETLVEPSSMLPVEVNIVRDGVLNHRASLGYGRMPGGRWYVAAMRSELALPGGHGRRFVSQRTHTNVESREER